VDFATRIPVRLKLRNLGEAVRLNENEPGKTLRYYQKTKDGKLILRRVMKRYIPLEVADAEKQGFSAPDASWFRGESMDYVRRSLCKEFGKIYDFLDRVSVQSLIEEHLQGKQNRRLFILSLLNFEHWCLSYL
jgi:asparagine synthase (glutamine-hydrolysing)